MVEFYFFTNTLSCLVLLVTMIFYGFMELNILDVLFYIK